MTYILKQNLDDWVAKKIGIAEFNLESLRKHQLERAMEVVEYAKISPFYARQFASCDCHIDFFDLPFTTQNDLKNHGKEMICVRQEEISRIVSLGTSGTTGASKRVYFTEADQELTIDFFANGMNILLGEADKCLILLPFATPGSVGDLLRQGVERFGGIAIFPENFDNYKAIARQILEEQPRSIVANPVQMLKIAYEYRALGGQAGVIANILLSTDYVAEALCDKLREIFGADIFHHYGTTEMGLGGGLGCANMLGYHLREADFLLEIIDPVTLKPQVKGKIGEIVYTTLTRKAMPLIRYRSGDFGRFVVNENCVCGSALPVLEQVRGRMESVLPLNMIDEAIFAIDGLCDYEIFFDSEVVLIKIVDYKERMDRNILLDLSLALQFLGYPLKLEYTNKVNRFVFAKRQVEGV